MAVIKIQSNFKGLIATVLDGYLGKKDKLEKICKEIHKKIGFRNMNICCSKYEPMYNIAITTACEAKNAFHEETSCHPAYCRLSLFKIKENKLSKRYYPQIYLEENLSNREKNRKIYYFLNVSKDCKNVDNCLDYMTKVINFNVRQTKDYHDYEKFCEDIKKLVKNEVFLVYKFPDAAVSERLRSLGFFGS